MAQWILKPNDQLVPRISVRRLTDLEITHNPIEEIKRQPFMEFIRSKLGNSVSLPSSLTKDGVDFTPYEDDEEIPRVEMKLLIPMACPSCNSHLMKK